jgi:hypothetical protein
METILLVKDAAWDNFNIGHPTGPDVMQEGL